MRCRRLGALVLVVLSLLSELIHVNVTVPVHTDGHNSHACAHAPDIKLLIMPRFNDTDHLCPRAVSQRTGILFAYILPLMTDIAQRWRCILLHPHYDTMQETVATCTSVEKFPDTIP